MRRRGAVGRRPSPPPLLPLESRSSSSLFGFRAQAVSTEGFSALCSLALCAVPAAWALAAGKQVLQVWRGGAQQYTHSPSLLHSYGGSHTPSAHTNTHRTLRTTSMDKRSCPCPSWERAYSSACHVCANSSHSLSVSRQVCSSYATRRATPVGTGWVGALAYPRGAIGGGAWKRSKSSSRSRERRGTLRGPPFVSAFSASSFFFGCIVGSIGRSAPSNAAIPRARTLAPSPFSPPPAWLRLDTNAVSLALPPTLAGRNPGAEGGSR